MKLLSRKCETSFLYVEFPTKNGESLFRMRYKVRQHPFQKYGIRICDRGATCSHGSEQRNYKQDIIHVDLLVSKEMLFEAVLKHVSERYAIPNNNLKVYSVA